MAMFFEELDSNTRAYMLQEFTAEQEGGTPYRSAFLRRLDWPLSRT